MSVKTRGKHLITAAGVLGLGLILSACAPSGPEGVYANGYYDYSDYYDPGYFDDFGVVGRDRDRRHDHDDGHDRGLHHGDYGMHGWVGRGMMGSNGPAPFTSRPASLPSGFGGGRGFSGGHVSGGFQGGGGRR